MDISTTLSAILCQILDLDPENVTPETYVIRDLDAESIDLLEIGVAMEQKLAIPIHDEILFLTNLRAALDPAINSEAASKLAMRYPHLPAERIAEILEDLESGPVLKVKDLLSYAKHFALGRQ